MLELREGARLGRNHGVKLNGGLWRRYRFEMMMRVSSNELIAAVQSLYRLYVV